MWYAATEIIFFLILAAIIGGLVGFGTAQIYQIDLGSIREGMARRPKGASEEELADARVEIADLRRKLDMLTDALRGDDAPQIELGPPIVAPSTSAEVQDTDEADVAFPPVPSTGHDGVDGRRLSERVADAERN